MYLHLGKDTVLRDCEILGFFDLDNISRSARGKNFLKAAEKAGNVELIGDDVPKSAVLCRRGEKTKLLLTQISTATLKARSKTVYQ